MLVITKLTPVGPPVRGSVGHACRPTGLRFLGSEIRLSDLAWFQLVRLLCLNVGSHACYLLGPVGHRQRDLQDRCKASHHSEGAMPAGFGCPHGHWLSMSQSSRFPNLPQSSYPMTVTHRQAKQLVLLSVHILMISSGHSKAGWLLATMIS